MKRANRKLLSVLLAFAVAAGVFAPCALAEGDPTALTAEISEAAEVEAEAAQAIESAESAVPEAAQPGEPAAVQPQVESVPTSEVEPAPAAQPGDEAAAPEQTVAYVAVTPDTAVIKAMGYTASADTGYGFTVYNTPSMDTLLFHGYIDGQQDTTGWYCLNAETGAWEFYATDATIQELVSQYYTAYPENEEAVDDATNAETYATAGMIDFPLTGTYMQSEARSMLKMVNDFRASSTDNWWWNSDNTTKGSSHGTAKPLQWDYTLEKAAMQRAMEIAIAFQHTRPDGRSWATAATDIDPSHSSIGENLAYGYRLGAENAFALWQESNENYGGQGHRRNMLSASFGAIGIACVQLGNDRFWVQQFQDDCYNRAPTAAVDGERTVTVRVQASLLKLVSTSPALLELEPNATLALPSTVIANYTCTATHQSNPDGFTAKPFTGLTWVSNNTSIAKIVGTAVQGVSLGDTTLTATAADGATVNVPVHVGTMISNASVVLSADSFTLNYETGSYSPQVQLPTVASVTLNGKTLVSGTDYTVSYVAPASATPGNYSVKLTGVGRYAGSILASYTIKPAALSGLSISTERSSFAYTGAEIKPECRVWRKVSQEGTTINYAGVGESMYTIDYIGDTINPGVVTVRFTGRDYYTGTVEKTYTIVKPSVAELPAVTYNGTAFTPLPVVKNGNTTLVNGTDYTVKYTQNTNAGTGKATVSFLNRYGIASSITKSFTIRPADLSGAQLSVSRTQYNYTGYPVTPDITLTLNGKAVPSGGYTITYSPDNTNIGTVNYTLAGTGNYTGSIGGSFTIVSSAPSAVPGTPTAAPSNPSGGSSTNTSASTGTAGFTDRLYSVCLGRTADAAGKADWVNQLTSYRISGTKAAYGFVFSKEFQAKNYSNADYVEHLYEAFMGRKSDAAGKADWVKQLEGGKSRKEVFDGFANSVEFDKICSSYGIVAKDIETFVTRFYSVCLGRKPDANGLADWSGKLRSKQSSGRDIAYGFIFSKEFTGKNYSNEDYVEHLYAAFMGRKSDAAGKADWVKQLQSGKSREDVFNGFVGSKEFSDICASYDIARG